VKIHQLLSGTAMPLSNEETQFVENHDNNIRISSLDNHDKWVAQNLVRKGVYSISNDSNVLIKNLNETFN
jgi:hypothetical protein